jgi:hypothetical protein
LPVRLDECIEVLWIESNPAADLDGSDPALLPEAPDVAFGRAEVARSLVKIEQPPAAVLVVRLPSLRVDLSPTWRIPEFDIPHLRSLRLRNIRFQGERAEKRPEVDKFLVECRKLSTRSARGDFSRHERCRGGRFAPAPIRFRSKCWKVPL